MGGVFKTPKPKMEPVIVQETVVDEDKARQEALARSRRGMESTIRTSYNGILGDKEQNLKRKQLLGE